MATAPNMTAIDRLAEKLKNEPIGEFLSEDDLLEICRKAIDKAFFNENIRITDDRGNLIRTESTVAAMAREHMTKLINEFVSEKFDQLINHEKFQEQLGNMMMLSMIDVMRNHMNGYWNNSFQHRIVTDASWIKDVLRSR